MSKHRLTGYLAKRLAAKLQGNTLNTMTLLNELMAVAAEQGDEGMQRTIMRMMNDQAASARLLNAWQSEDVEALNEILAPNFTQLTNGNGHK